MTLYRDVEYRPVAEQLRAGQRKARPAWGLLIASAISLALWGGLVGIWLSL